MDAIMKIAMFPLIGIIAVLLLIVIIKCCWKVAGTNEVLIVSGLGKVKKKTGGGIFVIPLVQKVQRMTLENIQVDFTSRNEIPTKDAIHVLVDAVANMAISKDPERQATAASKFAGYDVKQIRDIVIPVLEGNIREIISQTNFEDLIRGDKKEFSELVMENVTPNLCIRRRSISSSLRNRRIRSVLLRVRGRHVLLSSRGFSFPLHRLRKLFLF